jgi:hypothetical protein
VAVRAFHDCAASHTCTVKGRPAVASVSTPTTSRVFTKVNSVSVRFTLSRV